VLRGMEGRGKGGGENEKGHCPSVDKNQGRNWNGVGSKVRKREGGIFECRKKS